MARRPVATASGPVPSGELLPAVHVMLAVMTSVAILGSSSAPASRSWARASRAATPTRCCGLLGVWAVGDHAIAIAPVVERENPPAGGAGTGLWGAVVFPSTVDGRRSSYYE